MTAPLGWVTLRGERGEILVPARTVRAIEPFVSCVDEEQSCCCPGPNCSCIAGKLDPMHSTPMFIWRRTPRRWSMVRHRDGSPLGWFFVSPFPGSDRPAARCYGVADKAPDGCYRHGDCDKEWPF